MNKTVRGVGGRRRRGGYRGDQRRDDGESTDAHASRHVVHFNGQMPSSACPIGRAESALQDRSGAPRLFVSGFANGGLTAAGN
jgi:hypothetical protein